jgi:hypothetical protein
MRYSIRWHIRRQKCAERFLPQSLAHIRQ